MFVSLLLSWLLAFSSGLEEQGLNAPHAELLPLYPPQSKGFAGVAMGIGVSGWYPSPFQTSSLPGEEFSLWGCPVTQGVLKLGRVTYKSGSVRFPEKNPLFGKRMWNVGTPGPFYLGRFHVNPHSKSQSPGLEEIPQHSCWCSVQWKLAQVSALFLTLKSSFSIFLRTQDFSTMKASCLAPKQRDHKHHWPGLVSAIIPLLTTGWNSWSPDLPHKPISQFLFPWCPLNPWLLQLVSFCKPTFLVKCELLLGCPLTHNSSLNSISA